MLAAIIVLSLVLAAQAQQVNLYALGDNLISLESGNLALNGSVSTAVMSAQASQNMNVNSAFNSLNSASANTLVATNNRLAVLEVLASDFQRISAVSVPAVVASIKATVSQRISSEAATRTAASSTLQTLINSITTSANNGLTAAAANRAGQLSTMAAARATIQGAATVSMTILIGQEASRAAVETSSFNAMLSATDSSLVVRNTAAILAESSRANSALTMAIGRASVLSNQTGTTNDFAACNSSTAGTIYFSQGSTNIFVCDGTIFGSFLLGGFFDTTLLARNQVASLQRAFGFRWSLCYRASRDGYNGYIFHRLCDFRGPTVTILKNSAGRIYGGYVERPWTSSNMHIYSPTSYVFRFDPSNTANLNLAFINAAIGSSTKQYSTYDYQNYGPCFGSTGDIYVQSNIQSVSHQPNYYSATNTGGIVIGSSTTTSCGVTTTTFGPVNGASVWTGSYDSNALGGSSSSSGNEMETYYML